jgi:hypothetical protein
VMAISSVRRKHRGMARIARSENKLASLKA